MEISQTAKTNTQRLQQEHEEQEHVVIQQENPIQSQTEGCNNIGSPSPNLNRCQDPNPTTFVQADTATFKHVVQMLTGSSAKTSIPPIRSTPQKKPGFKLYERRNSLKNGLIIDTFSASSSPRKPEILSPSFLDFPSLVLSPGTPVTHEEYNLGKASPLANHEEKAIAQKRFYLHPSPRDRDAAEPRLLPLFPLTSPRAS